MSTQYYPRLCHITKYPDFQGFGFNLHSESDRTVTFIGEIAEGSPGEEAGLKEGDRIIEINGANTEYETHRQVIARVKAGGDEMKMLVVDKETDMYYMDKGVRISSSLPEVKFLANQPKREAEPEVEKVVNPLPQVAVGDLSTQYYPRLCHITKYPDFQGYGFLFHSNRDHTGHSVVNIDEWSPAEDAGLKNMDRIIEINGTNIENKTHQQVVARIIAGGNKTNMLVVDKETETYYKNKGVQISSNLPEVQVIANQPTHDKDKCCSII